MHTFKHEGVGHRVEVGIDADSWPDVADEFYSYLLGCGFVLNRQDLSDHFGED